MIVTKQLDCFIRVMMVTLLSGFAFAINRHLSAMTKRMAKSQIQGFFIAVLRLKTGVAFADPDLSAIPVAISPETETPVEAVCTAFL